MRRSNLVLVFISAVVLSAQMVSAQSLDEATKQCAERDSVLVVAAVAEGQQAEPKGAQQPTAPSGGVQELKIPGDVGGVHPGTKTQGVEPGFFQCDRIIKRCTCQGPNSKDCEIMKSIVACAKIVCTGIDCTCFLD
jgi:hypothetical protein